VDVIVKLFLVTTTLSMAWLVLDLGFLWVARVEAERQRGSFRE